MSGTTFSARRVARTGAGALLAIAVVAGCSADTTDTATSPTAAPSQTASATQSPADVCADVDTAKASLQALVETDIVADGTDTLRQRLATLEADLRVLVDSGRAELAPRSTAVKESLATLDEVLGGLADNPTAADLAAVKPALEAVKTTTEDLVTALDTTC